MAVYSEGSIPAEYAEVSSQSCRSGQPSPSPYATATLIGNSKIISSDPQRFNMFYTTDIYPPPSSNPAMMQNSINNNNNYNRSLHSESYCNSNNGNKVNIVENRMANTMMPNMFNQYEHNSIKIGSNKRNRLKLIKPQNFRINLGMQGEQLYVKVGDINAEQQQGQMQPQSTVLPPPQQHSYTWNPQNFNIYENHLHRQEKQQQQHHEDSQNAHETDTKTLNCD